LIVNIEQFLFLEKKAWLKLLMLTIIINNLSIYVV
jgi:hypothetical protein